MIRILDKRTEKFLNWLNTYHLYGVQDDCILSVLNCTDAVPVDEEGNLEQSFYIPDLNLITLTTEKPLEGIFDEEGKPAPAFYEDNYTLIKLAHEYAHFLQDHSILPNSNDEDTYEHTADDWAQNTVRAFIEWEKI